MKKDKIFTLSEIQSFLSDKSLTKVSNKTGLSYPTLKKLLINESKETYKLETIKIISSYMYETLKNLK